MQRRVLVIGGGLAGLTAAVTATRAGAAVTVLDARDHVGGRARTRRVDGFSLNQGAHALYRGGPGWQVLAQLGIEPQGGAPDASNACGLRADGRFGLLPGSTASLVRSRLLGLRAKTEVARLLGAPRRLLRDVDADRSMREWIDATARTADARAMLAMLARVATYCGDLDGLAADAGVTQMVSALTEGVAYLDGGWQQLVDALVDRLPAAVRVGTKAERVLVGPDGISVLAAGVTFTADSVILAAGGPGAAEGLLHGASAAGRTWAQDERPVFAAALDLGLRSLPVPSRRIAFGVDAPLYLSVHTPSARLAPEGGEVVHLLSYGDSSDDPRPALEALLDRAQPGWRDAVVAERYARRLVVAHGRPRPGSGLAGRPGPEVPDLPGVFVAGDWIGPRGLLGDAALASGAEAGTAAALGTWAGLVAS